jgi:YbbR domain-containing protein
VKTPDLRKVFDQWPAKVLALAAALLLFLFNRFDSLQVRTFSVPLRLLTDTALVPAQEFSHRVKVTLRGTDELVSAVTEADLEALVDYSGHQGEGVFSAPIQVNRRGAAAENTTLEVTVDPLVLNLHLERKVVKTVPVHPNFVGEPGRNYQLSGFQVTPSVVTIEGPRSVIDKVSAVSTEPVELRGKTDPFTLKVRVEAESGLLDFPYGSSVEVQGIMTSSLATLVLEEVQPLAVNLNPSLKLREALPPVRVRLRGTQAALDSLARDASGQPTASVVADLSASNVPGEIPAVELKAVLPDGVELVDLSPAVLSVQLEAKP